MSDQMDSFLQEEIVKQNCVLFVGAGLSIAAGLPGWIELLAKPAEELGLDINKEDPLDIAQYYVDSNPQGRYLLTQHIKEELARVSARPTPNHFLIKNMPFKVIITTNYDQLFEDTFNSEPRKLFHRIVLDSEIGFWKDDLLQLVKMHGSIDESETMIITREDYENYFTKYPRVSQRIKALMSHKTFLFLGYGMKDPDFAHIYNEIRRELGEYRRPFYFVSLRSNRYQIDDFRHRGIKIINLDVKNLRNPLEITEFLKKLADNVQSLSAPRPSRTIIEKARENLLRVRLASYLSLLEAPEAIDNWHQYKIFQREDLLDDAIGDFYSIRRLVGTNVTSGLSGFVPYLETSEVKIDFHDIKIAAINNLTKKTLLIEPIGTAEFGFIHPFKILLENSLAPRESFDLTFTLRIAGEMKVFSPKGDIQSVSLIRIKRGIENFEFSVVLNREPKVFFMEEMTYDKGRVRCTSEPILETVTEHYKDFPWSCRTPFRISWRCKNPKGIAYFLHYYF